MPGADAKPGRQRKSRSRHGITLAEYRDQMRLYRPDNPTSSKLNPEKVRHIRSSPASHAALARELNVGEGTIRAVRDYITWKHVR